MKKVPKPKEQYEDELDQEILGNQNTFKSDQLALMGGFSKKEAIPHVDVTDSHSQNQIFSLDQQQAPPLQYN